MTSNDHSNKLAVVPHPKLHNDKDTASPPDPCKRGKSRSPRNMFSTFHLPLARSPGPKQKEKQEEKLPKSKYAESRVCLERLTDQRNNLTEQSCPNTPDLPLDLSLRKHEHVTDETTMHSKEKTKSTALGRAGVFQTFTNLGSTHHVHVPLRKVSPVRPMICEKSVSSTREIPRRTRRHLLGNNPRSSPNTHEDKGLLDSVSLEPLGIVNTESEDILAADYRTSEPEITKLADSQPPATRTNVTEQGHISLNNNLPALVKLDQELNKAKSLQADSVKHVKDLSPRESSRINLLDTSLSANRNRRNLPTAQVPPNNTSKQNTSVPSHSAISPKAASNHNPCIRTKPESQPQEHVPLDVSEMDAPGKSVKACSHLPVEESKTEYRDSHVPGTSSSDSVCFSSNSPIMTSTPTTSSHHGVSVSQDTDPQLTSTPDSGLSSSFSPPAVIRFLPSWGKIQETASCSSSTKTERPLCDASSPQRDLDEGLHDEHGENLPSLQSRDSATCTNTGHTTIGMKPFINIIHSPPSLPDLCRDPTGIEPSACHPPGIEMGTCQTDSERKLDESQDILAKVPITMVTNAGALIDQSSTRRNPDKVLIPPAENPAFVPILEESKLDDTKSPFYSDAAFTNCHHLKWSKHKREVLQWRCTPPRKGSSTQRHQRKMLIGKPESEASIMVGLDEILDEVSGLKAKREEKLFSPTGTWREDMQEYKRKCLRIPTPLVSRLERPPKPAFNPQPPVPSGMFGFLYPTCTTPIELLEPKENRGGGGGVKRRLLSHQAHSQCKKRKETYRFEAVNLSGFDALIAASALITPRSFQDQMKKLEEYRKSVASPRATEQKEVEMENPRHHKTEKAEKPRIVLKLVKGKSKASLLKRKTTNPKRRRLEYPSYSVSSDSEQTKHASQQMRGNEILDTVRPDVSVHKVLAGLIQDHYEAARMEHTDSRREGSSLNRSPGYLSTWSNSGQTLQAPLLLPVCSSVPQPVGYISGQQGHCSVAKAGIKLKFTPDPAYVRTPTKDSNGEMAAGRNNGQSSPRGTTCNMDCAQTLDEVDPPVLERTPPILSLQQDRHNSGHYNSHPDPLTANGKSPVRRKLKQVNSNVKSSASRPGSPTNLPECHIPEKHQDGILAGKSRKLQITPIAESTSKKSPGKLTEEKQTSPSKRVGSPRTRARENASPKAFLSHTPQAKCPTKDDSNQARTPANQTKKEKEKASRLMKQKKSLLAQLQNTDGYIAEQRLEKSCDSLFDDPSRLGREQRALQVRQIIVYYYRCSAAAALLLLLLLLSSSSSSYYYCCCCYYT